MDSMFLERERGNEDKFKSLKVVLVMVICSIMVIPVIQHIQEQNSAVTDKTYTYHNEMVKFVGSNIFIGFNGNLFPVSWNVLELNPNYSPGHIASPFISPSIGTGTKNSPMIEETFNHYSSKRVVSLYQDSAVMIRWNHYVRIAEIFSFYNNGIDATVVMKNLNVTGSYIGAFSLGMGMNSTMSINGFYPSYQFISSGTGIIPSNDWNVSVGNIAINWQSEDSIFHSGIVSKTSSGDQIILPFYSGMLYHNESYTIDPMVYYNTYRTSGPIGPIGSGLRSDITFKESGLPSGTPWSATLDGVFQSATSNSITFSEPIGKYYYSIGSVDHYSVSPESGTVSVSGTSQAIALAYTQNSMYAVNFTESGLPSGTSWNVTLSGNTVSSSSNSITFSEYDGTYSYSIGKMNGYTISPLGGSVTVNNGIQKKYIAFTGSQPSLGHVAVSYMGLGSKDYNNLSDAINNASDNGSICYTNFMLPATISYLKFDIPYQNADMGNGNVNTYAQNSNPTASPDLISHGPPPGAVPLGISVYALSSNGVVEYLIYRNQDVSGNGNVSFTWTTQPGVYGGFLVQLATNTGTATTFYRHSFDVYSRPVNQIYSGIPCIADSYSQNMLYNSKGVYLGTLGTTVSNGPTKKNYSNSHSLYFGLSSFFFSPYDNSSANSFKYGVFSYNQYFNNTGSQYGWGKGGYVYPCFAANQNYQKQNGTTNETALLAEESIYAVIDNRPYLEPNTIPRALILGGLYPVAFQNQITKPDGFVWSNIMLGPNISYGQSSNLEGKIIRGGNLARPGNIEVYQIPNNGKSSPSLMEYFLFNTNEPNIPNVGRPFNHALNYYTYTTSETIVPVAHEFGASDYVNATWVSTGLCGWSGYYTYTGPSYTVATSLQLYIPLEG